MSDLDGDPPRPITPAPSAVRVALSLELRDDLAIEATRRPVVLAIDHAPTGEWLRLPGAVIIYLSGFRFEMQFRRGDTALAACKRIAREHRLVKMSSKAVWRSRPEPKHPRMK